MSAATAEFPRRCTASFCVDNHVAFGQEFTGYLRCGAEIAAAVLGEVDDERLHALHLQIHQGFKYFAVCGLGEIIEADQANLGCYHEGSIH